MHKLSLAAQVAPETVNLEDRTFEVLVNSGEPVDRFSWSRGPFKLTLSMKPDHVRLERLKAGAVPLMRDHMDSTINAQLGVVLSGGIRDGKLYAKCKMAADEEKWLARLADGTLRNISPGVTVHKLKDVTPENAQVKEFVAVDWEPHEVSMVAVPADKNAQVLSLVECLSMVGAPPPNEPRETMMDNNNPNPSGTGAGTPPPVLDQQAILKAERERVSAINTLAQQHNITAALAAEHVQNGSTIDQFRTVVLEALQKRSEQNPTDPTRAEVTRDRFTSVVEGLRQAFAARVEAVSDMPKKDRTVLKEGEEFRGMTMMEMARTYLRGQGVKNLPANKMELLAAALGFTRLSGQHTTSDFPEILGNTLNKSLLAGYEYANTTFRIWCKRSTSPDFKQISRTQLGDFPTLQRVNEGGEFTYGTIGEGAEKYALGTFGRIVGVTRQMIINDDLEAFSRIPMGIGAAAAFLENFTAYQVLTANAVMRDNNALFSVAHGNLVNPGTAISISAIGVVRTLMRRQRGLDGTLTLNLVPQFLLAPPELETVALQHATGDYVPDIPGNKNPYQGQFRVVVDAQLTNAQQWYMATSPLLGHTVEYAYLEGQEGVYTEQRVGFEVDGIEIKARLDFAAKALDWRGIVRNNGA